MSHSCFLSYLSKDRVPAERVYVRLAAAELDVWFDAARLKPSFEWHGEIEAACESSRVLLPLLTPNWKNSEWTRYETYNAENVIPLLGEGEWADVSTPPLARFQSVAVALGAEDETGAAVSQRVLYFEILLAFLDGKPPDELLRSMATELARPEAYQEWDLERMLEHLRPCLSPEDHALLTGLSHVINDRKAMPELDTRPAWRRAVPEVQ
jgi:hypothetical protein